MNNVNLKNSREEDVVDKFSNFLSVYSFGSGTKKDVDIELFMILCDLGIVAPTLLDVQCKLNVSRTNAKALIEERERRLLNEKLSRKTMEDVLKEELQQLLEKELFECENGKIKIEVYSPLLQEYIKEILRKQKHISDSSYSSDMVVMSVKAYVDLCGQLFNNSVKNLETEIHNCQIDRKLDEILSVLIEKKNNKKDQEKSNTASECLKKLLPRIGGVVLSKVDWTSVFEMIKNFF